MSVLTPSLTQADAGEAMPQAESAGDGLRRTAFYFSSNGQPIFAWLHRSMKPTRWRHGVVICPPIGYEQIHSHRSLRHLADALAQAGFSVFRFDYHGTGDSAGLDEDADRVATWLTNLRDAKAWMESELGCTHITLLGLRLGAAIAVQLAAESPVDSLILWSPVIKGRMYVRESKALGMTLERKPEPVPEAPHDIEAAGFVLTSQTMDDLGKINLTTLRPQCRSTLIIARDGASAETQLLEHFLAKGIAAELTIQPGFAEMMAEPHCTKVPRQAIKTAVDWLSAHTDEQVSTMVGFESDVDLHGEAAMDHAPVKCGRLDRAQEIRERVVRISSQPDLFGILTEPRGSGKDDLPVIVLTNAGAAHHVGPSRLYVLIARQLAAFGFRCLRVDFNGLGDSIAANPDRENDLYASTSFRDIDLTFKYLHAHHGANRVVLMGLCSGAYFAFQSAAQFANPALVESVLINPLAFYWKDGMPMEAAPAQEHATFHYYLRSALQPSKWLKLLSGRTQIGFFGAIRMLWNRWRQSGPEHHPESGMESPSALSSDPPGHPVTDDLTADLDRVAAAGRHLACFFSESDPGYRIMTFHAKRKVNELRQAGVIDVAFVKNADHTFSDRVPRRALLQAITEHFCRRYANMK